MVKIFKSKLFIPLLLLVFGFAYFSSFGKHVILFQNDEHLFLFTFDYLKSFLNMPGGFSEWFSSFFTQFYYYPLPGAFVISSLLLVVWLISRSLFSFYGLTTDMGLSFIIYGSLFGIVQFYENSLTSIVAVLINLSLLFLILRIKNTFIRYMLEVMSAVVLYTLTGAYFAIFIAVTTVSELILFNGIGRFVNLITIIFSGIYIPYFFSIHFYYLFAPVAYKYPVVSDAYFHGYSFAVINVVLLLLLLLAKTGKEYKAVVDNIFKYEVYSKAVLFTALVLYVVYLYNPSVAKLVYFVQKGKWVGIENSYSSNSPELWNEVLDLSEVDQGRGSLYPYYTNMALAYKGCLLDDMMNFNQERGVKGLYYPWVGNSQMREHGGLFYYSIGYVNEAHHWAYESMVHTGPVAPVLKELAVYNIVLGKIPGAKKYLNVLKQTLFYRSWADSFLALTDDTVKLNSLDWVVNKRNQIPKGDFFVDEEGVISNLKSCVNANPENRFAFDYLMAFYLLDSRPDKVSEGFDSIKRFYKVIPALIREALVLLPDYPPEFEAEHSELGKYIVARDKMLKSQFSKELFNKSYSKTYWFYIDFVSPHHKLKR